MFLVILIIWCYQIGCSQLQTKQALAEHCAPILDQIMDIQTERDNRMEGMQAASRTRKARKMSQEEHQILFDDWHAKEAELRSSANTLFIQAEADGCL